MTKKVILDIEKNKKTIYKMMREQHFDNIMESYDTPYKTEFDFNPTGKIFAFMMTENTCFRLRYGKCSLKLNFIDKLIISLYKIIKSKEYTFKYHKKWHPDYCPNLIKRL